MTYLITPLAPLQFRRAGDHIFSLGGYSLNGYIEYIPSPYAIIGAIVSSILSEERALYFSSKHETRINSIEDYFRNYESQIGEFIERLIGPMACLKNNTIENLLFPSPYDMFAYRIYDKGYLGFITPLLSGDKVLFHLKKVRYVNKDVYVHFADDNRCIKLKRYLIHESLFRSYIRQEERILDKHSVLALKSITRLRIALDRLKKVTQFFTLKPLAPPGALYYTTQNYYEIIDLKGDNHEEKRHRISLLVDVEIPEKYEDILSGVMLTLGGREGIAYVERAKVDLIGKLVALFKDVLNKVEEERVARIIFLTSPLASDSQSFFNHVIRELERRGFKNPRILTSFCEESPISGFDLRLAMNKPLAYGLRPGSVLIIKFNEVDLDMFLASYRHMPCMSQFLQSYGFGLFVIGRCEVVEI